jgi:GntR family transcriptional repressor for pyruvate dehydrogenase complex
MESEPNTQIYLRLPRQALSDQVVMHIQNLILSGELLAGDQLPSQKELAAQFGVSTAVIREAIGVLAERGLLEAHAGSGTFVSQTTQDTISKTLSLLFQQGQVSAQHLNEARRTLEVEIAGLAATRAKSGDIARLDATVERMGHSLDDFEQYIEADLDFHLALAEATHNPLYPMLVGALLAVQRDSRPLVFLASGGPAAVQISQLAHHEICDAIRRKDAEGAQKWMRQHLSRGASITLEETG